MQQEDLKVGEGLAGRVQLLWRKLPETQQTYDSVVYYHFKSKDSAAIIPLDASLAKQKLDPEIESGKAAEALLIHKGKIVAFGNGKDVDKHIQGKLKPYYVRLKDQTLIPGLIEGHGHIIRGAFSARGNPSDFKWAHANIFGANMTDKDLIDKATNAALSYGLTTINELNGGEGFIDMLIANQDDLRLRVNVYPEYNKPRISEKGERILSDDEADASGQSSRWFTKRILSASGDIGAKVKGKMLRLRGIKIFLDGAGVPTRGCPYLNTIMLPKSFADGMKGFVDCIHHYPQTNCAKAPCCCDKDCTGYGTNYITATMQKKLESDMHAAVKRGYRLAIHAMGNGAIQQAIDLIKALNAASAKAGTPPLRHQIHHNAFLEDAQVAAMANMASQPLVSVRGYVSACKLSCATGWRNIYGIGNALSSSKKDYEHAATRFLLPEALGARAFAEGDFGWRRDPARLDKNAPLNPFVTLYGLVTRRKLFYLQDLKDLKSEYEKEGMASKAKVLQSDIAKLELQELADGYCYYDSEPWMKPDGKWFAQERERALRMLTTNAAYAGSQETEVGSLEPGKYADIAILDTNILTCSENEIPFTKVLMTMVEGRTEYIAEHYEGLWANAR